MKKRFTRTTTLLALVAMSSGAQAGATLRRDQRGLKGYAAVHDANGNFIGDYNDSNEVSDGSGLSESRGGGYSHPDYGSAFGRATQTSYFTPGNPGIGGSFDRLDVLLSTLTDSDGHPNGNTSDTGISYVLIEFTVDSPSNWEWSGGTTGTSYGDGVLSSFYSFELYHYDQDGNHIADNYQALALSWNQGVGAAGTLQPGTYYYLDIYAGSGTGSYPGHGPDHASSDVYGAFTVRTCIPDCDQDGSLTFFDFLCFTNDFNAGGDYSDCDADGVLTFFDFLCFTNLFNAGC